jgi:DNA-binding transcriptional ArsR family regulator
MVRQAAGPERRFVVSHPLTAQRPLYEIKANLFKGLAHPLRIRILEMLSSADTVSVSDLLDETGLEASHLSQHLAVLRRHNLVLAERRASQMFYRLAYPDVAELLTVARTLLVKILESTQEQLLSTVGLPEVGRQDSPRNSTDN